MSQLFTNNAEDMAWLREVHGIQAQAALIIGNEDAPSQVLAWATREPAITDPPRTYEPDADGVLTEKGA